MDPKKTDFEIEIKNALSSITSEDLDCIQKAEIMLCARRDERNRAGGKHFSLIAITVGMACALAVALFIYATSPISENVNYRGDDSIYIEGFHKNLYSEGRIIIFLNENGEIVESKNAQTHFDIEFEGILAAYSVADYFEPTEEEERRIVRAITILKMLEAKDYNTEEQ